MYTKFAALCGCKSVVIPLEGVSKEEWAPEPALCYGVAYGFDDLEEAERTKPLLIDEIEKDERASINSVNYFIEKCYAEFT